MTASAVVCALAVGAAWALRRGPAPSRLRHVSRVGRGLGPGRGRRRRWSWPLVGSGRWRGGSSASGPVRVAQVAGELATLLRAGASPLTAWAQQQALADTRAGLTAAPLEVLLARAGQTATRGGDIAAVLSDGARHLPEQVGQPLRALATAWRLAEHTGAPAAEVLDRLAAGLRADADAEDARAAAMAAPAASARVLQALPVAGLVLASAVGLDPVRVLVTTEPGLVCAVAGLALNVVAWVWTRALLSSARAPR